jgi:CheY-like chemotaxis protein
MVLHMGLVKGEDGLPGEHCYMPVKILIVDDDSAFRQLLKLALAPAGAEIAEADCGEAGLAACGQDEFALAIRDYRMPGMNGGELAARDEVTRIRQDNHDE